MTTHDSKACCETPVAVAEPYTGKGSYKTIADTKCYVTGPADAKKGIYFMYDVFGFKEQTIQGADILASGGKEKYLVIMPDLFDGEPAEPEWLAKDTEEKLQKLQAFFKRIADPQPHIQRIYSVLEGAKKEFSSVQKWGAIGYCWGGKLTALTSGADTPWTAGVQTSPAQVDPEDAKKVTVPFATLASSGEAAETVAAFDKALTTPKVTHTFGDQVHGWMSARADLKDPKVKKEYERGYQIALEFFGEHL